MTTALEITLHEMLTCKPPRSELASAMAAMFKIVTGEAPTLAAVYGADAVDFARVCLQKAPQARPPCAQLRLHPFVAAGDADAALRALVARPSSVAVSGASAGTGQPSAGSSEQTAVLSRSGVAAEDATAVLADDATAKALAAQVRRRLLLLLRRRRPAMALSCG